MSNVVILFVFFIIQDILGMGNDGSHFRSEFSQKITKGHIYNDISFWERLLVLYLPGISFIKEHPGVVVIE